MNRFVNAAIAVTFGLATSVAGAAGMALITHNKTDMISKAMIDGSIPSTHPALPQKDTKISWAEVRLVCGPRLDAAGLCHALVKMISPSNGSEFDLGWVYMNIDNGDITPKTLTANGYTLTVNGPAETTITKN